MSTYRPLFSALPSSRSERWSLVCDFIDAWYAPLQPKDGFSNDELSASEAALGFPFPTALREWYELAGERKDVWSKQDCLLSPQEIIDLRRNDHLSLRKHRESLIFYAENQACECWAVQQADVGQDDPSVFRIEEPCQVSPAVSVFAIQVLLYESIWSRNIRGSGDFRDRPGALDQIRTMCAVCDLPACYWSALDPIRAYEAEDLIVVTHCDQWINVVARTEDAFQALPVPVRDGLERF